MEHGDDDGVKSNHIDGDDDGGDELWRQLDAFNHSQTGRMMGAVTSATLCTHDVYAHRSGL
jgi:hypothetical protein